MVGQVYATGPLRPASRHQHPKKNQGRRGRVLAFIPFDEDHPRDLVARVRYLDNHRVGRVELMYLVPADEAPAARSADGGTVATGAEAFVRHPC